MLKAEIENVLNPFNYQKALELYLPHCPSDSLKKLLESSASSPNTFTINKVKNGLRSLMDTQDTQKVIIPQPDPEPIKTFENPKSSPAENYRKAPLEVQKKISKRIDLVNEARLLKRDLENMDALQRRDAVLTIARNFIESQECYEYEQYWLVNGQLPPERKDITQDFMLPENVADLIKRRNTLRTYRRRTNWNRYLPEYNAILQVLKQKEID